LTDFITGDWHYPFHDKSAMKIMIRMAKHFKPKNIIINGDALDCVSLSRFTKEPQEPSAFKTQLEELCDVIKTLQKHSTITYIQGNHEARLERLVFERAPELHGLITMEKLVNDNLDTKIEYVYTVPSESMIDWRDDLIIGHFNVVRKYCGYTAKALVERFQTNVVQGHTHRLGEYALRVKGRTLRGFEGGCLCDLNPEYVMMPNWQQGFLVFSPVDDSWKIETVPIMDEKAIFRGKVYKP
jgi:UDP-2,3-diacylglucosamine pyrophosphatase LpxH